MASMVEKLRRDLSSSRKVCSRAVMTSYHPFLLVLEGANEKAAICHSKPRLGLSISICHMDVSAEDRSQSHQSITASDRGK